MSKNLDSPRLPPPLLLTSEKFFAAKPQVPPDGGPPGGVTSKMPKIDYKGKSIGPIKILKFQKNPHFLSIFAENYEKMAYNLEHFGLI
jgi:hypothetical protein